jgi:hypothetical protein
MQYSPQCAIPPVSMVDAGTVELVCGLGVEVVSSADLIQYFEARWNEAALDSHLEAGRRVDQARRRAFEMIGSRTRRGDAVSEYEVVQTSGPFTAAGLVIDGLIVAVNAHARILTTNRRRKEVADPLRRFRPDRYVGQARQARIGLLRHHRTASAAIRRVRCERSSAWCGMTDYVERVKRAVAGVRSSADLKWTMRHGLHSRAGIWRILRPSDRPLIEKTCMARSEHG